MDSFSLNLFIFITGIIISLNLGFFIRRRLDSYRTKKLIKELETYFGKPLPHNKKSQDPTNINWERVLKMLKNEPTTEQVAHWKELLKKRLESAKKPRRR